MAFECVVEVTRDCSSKAVLTRRITKFGIPGAIHLSRSDFSIPLRLAVLVKNQ